MWHTAQRQGALGRLDPATGAVEQIPLGSGSAPHGVIIGPDGAPWITDSGLNAIVRVDPATRQVRVFPLPAQRSDVNLNTAAFDLRAKLWFTGQNGVYGRLAPETGEMRVSRMRPGGRTLRHHRDPRRRHLLRLPRRRPHRPHRYANRQGRGHRAADPEDTAHAGSGRTLRSGFWVSEWIAGQVSVYDPETAKWRSRRLPGDRPQAYAVYVDEKDRVWLSDFGANAVVLFEPEKEHFEVFPSDRPNANVRQILGRPGEVWAPESGTDRLVVYRTGS